MGPFHLISRIFGPKGDTRHIVPTPSKLSTCVFDAANEDIGLVPVPSRTSQMPNIPAAGDCWEIEQGVHYSEIFHGKLRACASFWRDTICASGFVLDIIEHGYKIPFKTTPPPYSIENRSSATFCLGSRFGISLLFGKPFRNCWPVDVCEKLQIIRNFVIHCMLLSSRPESYGLS